MLTSEQEELKHTIRRLVTDRSGARRAAEGQLSVDRELWRQLAELGLLGIALPGRMGGVELGLAEEAAVAEALSAMVAPAPVVSTYLAAHILGAAEGDAAEELARDLVSGKRIVAPCLNPEDGRPYVFTRSGGDALTGEAPNVFEGGGADVFLVYADDGAWWALSKDAAGVSYQPIQTMDATRPLARLAAVDATARRIGTFDPAVAHAIAQVLLSAEAVGVSQAALDMAVAYSLLREQFGQVIGRFQAIKQKLADALISTEAARSALWGALRSIQDGVPDEQSALLAKLKSSEAAPHVVGEAVQIHGAIGVTWEHDLHLLQRRAKHCQASFGSADDLYPPLGDELMAKAPPSKETSAGDSLDIGFTPSPEDEAFIQEFRAWCDEHATPERIKSIRSLAALREWQGLMADAGWVGVHWPKANGGRDASFTQQVLYYAEMTRRGLPRFPGNRGLMLVGPTLIAHGNEATRRLIEPTRRADILWAGGFSERGAGSDLASLRTRGVVSGDELVINGHKIWTSQAHYADYIYALIRTDPDAPKHAGISAVVIPMSTKGLEVRPIRRNTGDHNFNEVFFDDVRVPLTHVLGALNNGWQVNRTTMVGEHLTNFLGSQAAQATTLRRIVRELGAREARTGTAPGMRRRVAEAWATTQVVRLHGLRNIVRFTGGDSPGAEGSIQKLVGQEHEKRLFELLLDVQGVGALRESPWSRAYLSTRASTIGGGTSEIHRNKLAERVLGLPRDLWADEDLPVTGGQRS